MAVGRRADRIAPWRPHLLSAAALLRADRHVVSCRHLSGCSRVEDALRHVGLEHLVDRLDEEAPWEHTLSGGEKQRLAFARVFLHNPNIIVLDEATAALDPESQDRLMELVSKQPSETTLISVGHRPELESYHNRKGRTGASARRHSARQRRASGAEIQPARIALPLAGMGTACRVNIRRQGRDR